jgi:PKD repeat protein
VEPSKAAAAAAERPAWEKWALAILGIIVVVFLALWLMRDQGTGGSATAPTPEAGAPTTEAGLPSPTVQTGAATTAPSPGQPSAVIEGPASGTVGQALLFSGGSSTAPGGSAIVLYSWDFGDGSQANGAEVTHAYDLAGSFVVRLGVQDASGQINSTRHVVTIQAAPQPPPSAVISGPSTAQVGQSLNFNGSASTAPAGATLTGYAWTFGDGSQATGQAVSHAFANAGTYHVVLNVVDSNGLSDSTSLPVVVSAVSTPQPPQAVIQAPTSGTVGQVLTFSASGSTSGSPITSYLWKFGDGGGTNAVVAQYAYDTAGSFTVSLTVVNQAGQESTVTSPIQIAAAPSAGPKAVVTGPATAVEGQPVSYSASSSTAGSSPIASYTWTVNGVPVGSAANGFTLNYRFTTPGQFVVEVLVTDQAGESDSASLAVAVSADLSSAVWVLNASDPPITLSAYEGQGSGSSGCNTYQFPFTNASPGASSGSLTLGTITSSGRECQAAVMDQEQQYISTLQAVTGYSIAGDQLLLTGPNGTLAYTMR